MFKKKNYLSIGIISAKWIGVWFNFNGLPFKAYWKYRNWDCSLSQTKSVVIFPMAVCFFLLCVAPVWNKQTHLNREIYFWMRVWCDWLRCRRFLIRVRLAPCLNVYSALAEQLSQRPIMGYWSAPRSRRKTFLISLLYIFFCSCRAGACSLVGLFCERHRRAGDTLAWRQIYILPKRRRTTFCIPFTQRTDAA